ncbi:class I SAM-dependent methyltransferase [Microbacterium sp. Marseille-Q6648]|uniref:class I SAM-dependent methyltransferase n=1 Tax=Microbacterium sp. Marseille-Q6648 TaxID=2937991 RepID=UPI00203D5E8E|nr:class I SAM-dependent methyltransferase [Microbacterium sp. Marseille-Q6648]
MKPRESPAGDFDYEALGSSYASVRRSDARLESLVRDALGECRTVLNVGAGAGSYEPVDRYVVAVEPSRSMRAQRPQGAAPAVDATAERLPFDEESFDAAMAVMTVHQWQDVTQGLKELQRVARDAVVVMTLDAPALRDFWLTDYIPEVVDVEVTRFPPIELIARVLGGKGWAVDVAPVPVPRDCTDGFGEAFYARPEAFLDPTIRRATSGLVLSPPAAVERGIERLREDLASGVWDKEYGLLRALPQRRGAIRLITATRIQR